MQSVPFFNVATAQVSQHQGSVVRIRGNFNGSANSWLWLFDTNGQPVVTTTGLEAAFPLYVGAAFFIDAAISNIEFTTGLYVGVSSTQETYTAAATQKMDITVELSDPEFPKGNPYAGDTTTGVDSLVVYASSATNNLYALNVSNSTASTNAPVYLQLFTASGPATGAVPAAEWTLTATSNLVLKFGRNGMHPKTITQSAAGVQADVQGCYLYGSSTAGKFTATTGTHWTMQAEYGAQANG